MAYVIPIVTALLALMIMVMTAGASFMILLKSKVATNRDLKLPTSDKFELAIRG